MRFGRECIGRVRGRWTTPGERLARNRQDASSASLHGVVAGVPDDHSIRIVHPDLGPSAIEPPPIHGLCAVRTPAPWGSARMNIPASPMSAGSIPPRRPVAAPGDRWRLDRLVTSPHRLGFATGAAMLSITAAWWLAVLAAGSIANITVPWTIAPRTAHAFAMTFAFVPMFFAGFLFTAGPRWLAQPPVAARALLPGCLAWITGWIVFLVGAHANPRLAALGLALVAAGWTLIAIRFARLVLASRAPDRTHPGAIAVACGLGAATLWLAAWSLATANDRALDLALSAGRWWFIARCSRRPRTAWSRSSASPRRASTNGIRTGCSWTWLATARRATAVRRRPRAVRHHGRSSTEQPPRSSRGWRSAGRARRTSASG
jgi:hypothetical protein